MEESRNGLSKLVVCLDIPEQHIQDSGRSTKVHVPIGRYVEIAECDYKVAKDLRTAEDILKSEKVDFLIIHHHGFKEVDYLKPRYPNVKYVGTSSLLMPESICRPGSLADEYRKSLADHYDTLLADWGEELIKMLESFLAKKLHEK
jgi:hypothetical protein